jgi:uncharacterized protein YbjT (DUF2867 family)
MKLKVIITGSTGMVGEGVLHECILHQEVEKILVINRRPGGVKHPKVTELIHSNFFNIGPVQAQLTGYNACFFCLGVSSINKKEPEYFSLTHTLTLNFAEKLAKLNPEMVFCYISGAGTDSSESGNLMWARIKGKTENDLMKLGFKKVYAFRPGLLQPTAGLKNAHRFYYIFRPVYPVLKLFLSRYISTLGELGLAMINSVTKGYEKQVLEVPDIITLSRR